MRKQLYLDIKNRLQAMQDENGEPLFRHFDLWNKQAEAAEEEAPFACPAVFVEFGAMNWKTLGKRVQDCSLTVRLHIVTARQDAAAGSPPVVEQALEFLDISDSVVAEMQQFGTGYMSGWMRTQSITCHDNKRYADNVEEYSCNLRDASALKRYEPVTPGLSITEDTSE